MKTLLVIRHAKSSWDDAAMNDFDRPLNDRGRKDAPVMAKRLIKAHVKIDLFASSTAKRALSTAELFIREFGRTEKEILRFPELYHAQIHDFRDVIANLDDRYESAALFSHNPGITAFANTLTSIRLDNMPTCSIFAVSSQTTTWNQFTASGVNFWFFDYPKSGEAR